MSENRTITCVVCPMGCRMDIQLEKGRVTGVHGCSCKRGAAYAEAECTNPSRMLTTTVRVQNGQLPLVPVKTDKPVPKAMMMECMWEINRLVIKAPVKIGDVLLKNIAKTDVNIVATGCVPDL